MYQFRIRTAMLLLLTAAAACWAQGPEGGPPPGSDGPGADWQNSGQARGPRVQDAKHSLERLSKELKLTDDQKQKIKPILEAQEKQMRALREDSSLDMTARRTKMHDIRQQGWDQIRPTLNDTQQKKLDAMIARNAEREKHMEENRRNGNGPGGPPPDGPAPGDGGGPPPSA